MDRQLLVGRSVVSVQINQSHSQSINQSVTHSLDQSMRNRRNIVPLTRHIYHMKHAMNLHKSQTWGEKTKSSCTRTHCIETDKKSTIIYQTSILTVCLDSTSTNKTNPAKTTNASKSSKKKKRQGGGFGFPHLAPVLLLASTSPPDRMYAITACSSPSPAALRITSA